MPHTQPPNHRTRCVALLVATVVMSVCCIERMAARPVKQADIAATRTVDYRIGVNRADRDTLRLLPRVGPGIAQHIVDTRSTVGRFDEPSDLTQVPMIGDKTAAAIAPWVRFD